MVDDLDRVAEIERDRLDPARILDPDQPLAFGTIGVVGGVAVRQIDRQGPVLAVIGRRLTSKTGMVCRMSDLRLASGECPTFCV